MKLREIIGRILRFLGFRKLCRVDYISTGEALPAPMTAEDEAATVEETQSAFGGVHSQKVRQHGR